MGIMLTRSQSRQWPVRASVLFGLSAAVLMSACDDGKTGTEEPVADKPAPGFEWTIKDATEGTLQITEVPTTLDARCCSAKPAGRLDLTLHKAPKGTTVTVFGEKFAPKSFGGTSTSKIDGFNANIEPALGGITLSLISRDESENPDVSDRVVVPIAVQIGGYEPLTTEFETAVKLRPNLYPLLYDVRRVRLKLGEESPEATLIDAAAILWDASKFEISMHIKGRQDRKLRDLDWVAIPGYVNLDEKRTCGDAELNLQQIALRVYDRRTGKLLHTEMIEPPPDCPKDISGRRLGPSRETVKQWLEASLEKGVLADAQPDGE